MLWMLLGTLAAAIARQEASQSSMSLVGLAEAWGVFRTSLQGANVPFELQVQFDLMEERGELPPGWIVHPELGLLQLFDPVVQIVNDDNALSMLEARGIDHTGWKPVQLFMHANPETDFESNEFLPKDTLFFYALKCIYDRGGWLHTEYNYRTEEAWADASSIESSLWEREMDSIEEEGDEKATMALAYFDDRLLFPAFSRGMRGWEGTMEQLHDEVVAEVLPKNGQMEDENAWFLGSTDSWPSDNEGFEQILELLEAHGISIGSDLLHVNSNDEVRDLTELDDGSATPLALKHGFIIAQVQDGFDIPYYRNYVIHPLSKSPLARGPAIEDAEADAKARAWMRQLPTRVEPELELEVKEFAICSEEMGAIDRHRACILDSDRQKLFNEWNLSFPEEDLENPFYPPENGRGFRVFVGYEKGRMVAGARLIETPMDGQTAAYIEFVKSKSALFLPRLLKDWKKRYRIIFASLTNPKLGQMMGRAGFVSRKGPGATFPFAVWMAPGTPTGPRMEHLFGIR